jgi:hypothetical protein
MKIKLFALAFVCTAALPSTLALEGILEFGELRGPDSGMAKGMTKTSPLAPMRHDEG